MSRRNGQRLELKLNVSPPRMNNNNLDHRRAAVESPKSPSSSDEEEEEMMSSPSTPRSCVSSEGEGMMSSGYLSSPEATSVMLVGCPRCLMYVMVAESEPRCPQCKSSVLLNLEEKTQRKNN